MQRKKLTDDFFEDEFYSPDTKTASMNPEFMIKLQRLRTTVGVPFRIGSGWRTREYNAIVKGGEDSEHMEGNAADIDHSAWNGHTRRKFLMAALALGFSVGIYRSHFHVDNRTGLKVVWIGTNVKD